MTDAPQDVIAKALETRFGTTANWAGHVLTALKEAGCEVVPSRASEAMVDTAIGKLFPEVRQEGEIHKRKQRIRVAWRAMITAAEREER